MEVEDWRRQMSQHEEENEAFLSLPCGRQKCEENKSEIKTNPS